MLLYKILKLHKKNPLKIKDLNNRLNNSRP